MRLTELFAFQGPKLDPARTAAARRKLDDIGGYDVWHADCRKLAPRADRDAAADAVADRGYAVVRVLPADEAGALKARLLAENLSPGALKDGVYFADTLRFPSADHLYRALEAVLGPAVDRSIAAWFGCEYLVYSAALIRSFPVDRTARSLRWHCDRGPRNFLKLNLFLDGTAEHGATTAMLDREGSEAAERIGYTFGPNKRRVERLERLQRRAGVGLRPETPSIDAGEAILFPPALALHRGVPPSRNARHMFSIMVAPSPLPWRDAYRRMAASRFVETNRGEWLPQADELFDRLGIERPSSAAGGGD